MKQKPMVQLTQTDLDKFKEIYKREYGVELTDQDALDQGTRLINLMKIVYGQAGKNPWEHLPEQRPFVLKEDKREIEEFNDKHRGHVFEVVLDDIPSPYIGNPFAPVVFLNLNPRYDESERQSPEYVRYQTAARNNLLHDYGEYPFYVLDPTLDGTPSGYRWFSQRFGPLISATGLSAREVAHSIFLAEYFPYRSKKYGWRHPRPLASQFYTCLLVRAALARGAIVVIMRAEKLWKEALPELETYEGLYVLNSPQNVTVSEQNVGKEGFVKIVEKIRQNKPDNRKPRFVI